MNHSASWQRLNVMVRKELLQLSRDWVLLAFILYAFTVDILLAGSGVTLQLNHAAFVVDDHDRTPASRELVSRFHAPYFRFDGLVTDPWMGLRRLDDGKAMMVLSIPPGFEEDLALGHPTQVALQVDTTNSVLGFLAASDAARITGQYGLENALDRLGIAAYDSSAAQKELPVVENASRVWFNPNQDDSWFMSISQLLNIVTVFSILLPATAMVREKERGTIEQLMVSPLNAFQILFPKVIAMTGVILLGAALSLFVVLLPVFHVPAKGSLVLFFALTALYVFTTAGLGLFAATLARNLAQVGMLTILILAPMLFLSGAWTPPEAMPWWLRDLMFVSPLHYYIEIAFGILLKGQTAWQLLPLISGMLIIGLTVFGFGLWGFRRQLG